MTELFVIRVLIFSEEIAQKCSVKKGILRNFSKFTVKHQCNLIKKETMAQVFSCEFCEISKNTLSYRTPPVAASVFYTSMWLVFGLEQGALVFRTKIASY